MKKSVLVLAICLSVFMISCVSASFTYSNNTIKQNYMSGEQITGVINLKIQNESFDSLITTNLNGSITLGDLLKLNKLKEGYSYTCSSINCTAAYVIKDQATDVELDESSPVTVGFKVSGQNIQIQDFSINVASNAQANCRKQITADIFSNQTYYLQNSKYLSSGCGEVKTGCFDSTLPGDSYRYIQLTSVKPYCIKQILPAAPAYQIGAKLMYSGLTPNENLTMTLYPSDFSTTPLGRCTPSDSSGPSDSGTDASCTVQYGSDTEREYYICISSDKQQSGWQIRAESTSPTCGAYAPSTTNIQTDFDMYAQPLEYDSPNFILSAGAFNRTYYANKFADVANDFIQSEYNGDCIQNTCIIPITLIGIGQTVTLSNPSLTYQQEGVSTVKESRIYTVEKDSAQVSTDLVSLNLAPAGFTVPYGTKPTYVKFYLNGRIITQVPINVTTGLLFDITPKFSLIGVPIRFSVTSAKILANAVWHFGDDNSVTVGLNVSHKFAQQGTYNLIVDVTSSDGEKSSRTFQIVTGEPQTSAMELLSENKINMATVFGDISLLPLWIQNIVRSKIDVTNMNKSLNLIDNQSNYANSDSEYIDVINNVQALQIPDSIGFSKQGTYPLALLYNHIDTTALASLSSQQITNAETTKAALVSWLSDNYDAQVKLGNLASNYGDNQQGILSTVSLLLTPKQEATGDEYIIINYPLDAIVFKQDYGQKAIDSATYIPLTKDLTEVDFVLPDEISTDALDVYIAPKLDALTENGDVIPIVTKKSETQFILLWGILLVILVLGAAFGLQYWYKRRYEKYLFKKEEDLYNVMTFIYNSRNAGLESKEIKKKLSESSWSGEQIKYAFDKINGRVLGIFGIPIFKSAQERRVTSQIQKRQQLKTDITFIKRPTV